MSLVLDVPNSLEGMTEATEAVVAFLSGVPRGLSVEYLARLALEELITNVIKYGHADGAEHAIRVEARVENEVFHLCLIDDGGPFDPCSCPDPDTSLPASERPIGGLGLFLVRNMSDTMTYERVNETNVVTLTKKLEAA